ncbi:hypothetical protein QVD17_01946 [Tagetes erecta]|uniref:Uncharacterized protein n=1 Tax=Tagetes erecta TaxID=13708 RepID=A0AAD8L895_TARER|nr:hypothetical protein QVD17_01946 [Tagetes erecta]
MPLSFPSPLHSFPRILSPSLLFTLFVSRATVWFSTEMVHAFASEWLNIIFQHFNIKEINKQTERKKPFSITIIGAKIF